MKENYQTKYEKVDRLKSELLSLYSEIYPFLSTVDSSKYPEKALQDLDVALDPPEKINEIKAIAIIKSVSNSFPGDIFQLTRFSPVVFYEDHSVGTHIRLRIEQLGISENDLDHFLIQKGWKWKD